MSIENEIDAKDVIRIMITTDNHLGYGEKDPIIGEDSFIAFEEMLQLAVQENVDFILLGGDLFHDAVPSQNTLLKCMQLLRQYTFGDKSIDIELLSDSTQNFHCAINASVNYEDPNLNIAIPVYTIHGNHDDPSAFGGTSPLDLLSTAGLINYFGRWTDLTKIEIIPILMRKGVTNLALYGLSHIHDARLCRLFECHKVNMRTPLEDDDNWFHLMVLHQNRADRGHKNYLPEVVLPDFLNLIMWGHEHDCRIEPEYNATRDFYVSQPGSTVPTSLCEGETARKCVAILEIYKNKFQLKPVQLQSVRPFVFESINIDELSEELNLDEGDASNKIRSFAEKRIESMLTKANQLLTENPRQPKLPLLRLRLEYSNEQHMFNSIRLGQIFNDRVANPSDIVRLKRLCRKGTADKPHLTQEVLNNKNFNLNHESFNNVEDLICNYFNDVDDNHGGLKVLTSEVLTELCKQLVHRYDINAVDNMLRCYKSKILDFLLENVLNEDNVDKELNEFRKSVNDKAIEEMLNKKQLDKPEPQSSYEINKKIDEDFKCNINANNALGITGTNEIKNENEKTSSSNEVKCSVKTKSVKPRRQTRQDTKPMHKLDVSVSSRSTRQSALVNLAMNRAKPVRKSAIVEISDDSS